jgi:serine protease
MIYQDLDGDGTTDGILSTAYFLGEGFIYYFFQGTSLAAPQVAGVAGLLATLRPDWGPEEIAGALLGSAVPIPKSYCPGGCGAGALNAPGAVKLAEAN